MKSKRTGRMFLLILSSIRSFVKMGRAIDAD